VGYGLPTLALNHTGAVFIGATLQGQQTTDTSDEPQAQVGCYNYLIYRNYNRKGIYSRVEIFVGYNKAFPQPKLDRFR